MEDSISKLMSRTENSALGYFGNHCNPAGNLTISAWRQSGALGANDGFELKSVKFSTNQPRPSATAAKSTAAAANNWMQMAGAAGSLVRFVPEMFIGGSVTFALQTRSEPRSSHDQCLYGGLVGMLGGYLSCIVGIFVGVGLFVLCMPAALLGTCCVKSKYIFNILKSIFAAGLLVGNMLAVVIGVSLQFARIVFGIGHAVAFELPAAIFGTLTGAIYGFSKALIHTLIGTYEVPKAVHPAAGHGQNSNA